MPKHLLEEVEKQYLDSFIAGLTPMDDIFMRCLFRDNLPLVQHIVRTLTQKPNLIVVEYQTQMDMKRLSGSRSIVLDIYAVDSTGKKYDIEIQRGLADASPHRARYYASVLDVENLKPKEKFDDLKDHYVIFIFDKDPYGEGLPFYLIDRTVHPIEKAFGDGSFIIYANGEYRGEDPIGQLMHDLNTSKASDMYLDLMAQGVGTLKETEKGVEELRTTSQELFQQLRAQWIEQGLEQGLDQKARSIALKLLKEGTMSLEWIAQLTDLSLEEVKSLQNQLVI